jgi:GT2 family glycosyltransferase
VIKRGLVLIYKTFVILKDCGLKVTLKKIHDKLLNIKEEQKFYVPMPSEEELEIQKKTVFPKEITFSILVPLYNTPENFLKEMIDSVENQTYGNWELCLADGSDGEHQYVERVCLEYQKRDGRIKYRRIERNLGISGNTNICFEMATGDYIGLFDHDDILHPSVLYKNMEVICKTGADFIYTDEATFEGEDINNIITMHFKPDYAKDNLRANNYICHFSVFDKKLLKKTGLFRSEYDGSQDHDMILRLTTAAQRVEHIPEILYFWRSHSNSVAADINSKAYAVEAGKRAVADHIKQCGLKGTVESSEAFPTIYRIRYQLKEKPLISILIPNKDHVKELKKCIRSVEEKTTYPKYEIIIIENNSSEEKTFRYYEELKKKPNIRVVIWEKEFNYAAINNFGEKYAKGEYLVLLNNDIEIITEEWLEEMLMYAQREDVGAVGAKLLYKDNTIQHAGIVIGLGAHRAAGHTHYCIPRSNPGYMGKLYYAQDVTAVTGACLMVKRKLYEEVFGLDEDFKVALNDVDFCLKLRKKGYLNIFTPYALAYHYESKSRGFEDTEEKQIRYQKEVQIFRQRWKEELEKGDPYYNRNFSLDRADFWPVDRYIEHKEEEK